MNRLTKRIDGRLVFPSDLVGVMMTPSNDTMCRILNRLAAYEDTGLEPEDVRRLQQDWTSLIMALDEMGGMPHLHELVQAEKAGRLSILPKSQDGTCGSCGHFNRIPGKRCGTCEVRSNYTDRWGRMDARRGTFTPSQSRKCCKQYIPREEAEEALAQEGGKPMREILFRGKRLDNGEWVEGYLVHSVYKVGDACVGKFSCTLGMHQVDHSTVGQYTGLNDKNGKQIFEGDIVRYTFDSPDDPTATENGLKVRTGRIFWSDWRASFAVTAGRNLSAALNNDVAVYVRGRQVYEYVRGANTVEVIGNIHDNPELLKGGEG